MKMIVTRPFLLAGMRQEIGAEIEITDRGLASILLHEGKATEVDQSAPARGPMTTETMSGMVAGGKGPAPRASAPKKGDSNE